MVYIYKQYTPTFTSRQLSTSIREPVLDRSELNSSRAQVISWTTTTFCHVRLSCYVRSRSSISWNRHQWRPSVRSPGTHGGTRVTRPIFRATLSIAHRFIWGRVTSVQLNVAIYGADIPSGPSVCPCTLAFRPILLFHSEQGSMPTHNFLEITRQIIKW